MAERNITTNTYAAYPNSNAIVDVPVISLNSSVSECESPSTTTSIGFLTRDPIGYADGFNQYRCYFAIGGIDPSGLYDEPAGPGHGPGKSCEDYWSKFLADHPGLEKEFPKCWRQYTRGCIGVTLINLGEDDLAFPSFQHCYRKKEDAEAYLKKITCGKGETPEMFSVHFYLPPEMAIYPFDDEPFKVRPDGSVDVDPWATGGMPKKNPSTIRFDFGFCKDDGTIIHANHCHNPTGKEWPGYPIVGPMVVYTSTLDEWKQSYNDFNQEVWCVTCAKPFKKGR